MSTLSNIPLGGLQLIAPNVIPTTGTTYGVAYSSQLIGGYQEVATLDELNMIPIDYELASLYGIINEDGMSSGRRRIGMSVYVAETNKTYQLLPVGYLGNRGNGSIYDWFASDYSNKLLSLDSRKVIISDFGETTYSTIGPITGTSTGTTFTIITGDTTSNIINPDDYSGVTVSPWVEVTNSSLNTYVVSGSILSGTTNLNLVRNDGTGITIDLAEAITEGYTAFTGATLSGSAIYFSGNNINQTLDLSPALTGSTGSNTVIDRDSVVSRLIPAGGGAGPTTLGTICNSDGNWSIANITFTTEGTLSRGDQTHNLVNMAPNYTKLLITTSNTTVNTRAIIRTSAVNATAHYGVPNRAYLYFSVTFSVPLWNAGQKFFIGRVENAIAGSGTISGHTNMIGVGKDVADTTLQLMVNDGAGAATKVDTLITPNTFDLYKLIITSPNNYTGLTATLKTLTTSGTTEITQTFTTNLPVFNVSTFPYIHIVNAASGSKPELGIINMYEEKFNLG
jgi:hypothetical protein